MSVRQELENRTKRFAIRIIGFVNGFGRSKGEEVIAFQLAKAGTSIGANYREAGRASSQNDFIHKMGIVEREAAEAQYWLEICSELSLGHPGEAQELLSESTEILAIMTAACRKARANKGAISECDPPFDIE